MTQKILVVDDSRTVRTVVEWVFHGSPYTIISAGTASDGIRLLREHLPSVALIDYALPDQSGFELCQEIRRDATLASIRLIMLGGTWGGFDETRATACADDFIYKPFKTDALLEKISSVSARATSRAPQVTPGAPVPEVSEASPGQADGLNVAGMPAALSVANEPSTPPLTPPTPPQEAGEAETGFRRVRSVAEDASGVEEPAGPPPLPRVSGPPPTETPLPAPVEVLSGPPPMPALIPSESVELEPIELESTEAVELPALDPLPQVTPPTPEPVPPAQEQIKASEPAGRTEAGGEIELLEEADTEAVHVAPAPLAPAAAPVVDEAQVRQLVREMLPPIVKEVLAGLLRQTIGTRVEAYATKKIDSFIDSELPRMAEKAIDAQLEVLYANVEE